MKKGRNNTQHSSQIDHDSTGKADTHSNDGGNKIQISSKLSTPRGKSSLQKQHTQQIASQPLIQTQQQQAAANLEGSRRSQRQLQKIQQQQDPSGIPSNENSSQPMISSSLPPIIPSQPQVVQQPQSQIPQQAHIQPQSVPRQQMPIQQQNIVPNQNPNIQYQANPAANVPIPPNPQQIQRQPYPPQQQQLPPQQQQQVPPPQAQYQQQIRQNAPMPPAGGQPPYPGQVPPQMQQRPPNMPPQSQQLVPPGQYMGGQQPGYQAPSIPPGGYPGQIPQNQAILKFDQTVQSYVQSMNNIKTEFSGIQVEMPKINFNYLQKNFEQFIVKATPQDKMQFLESTLLKRKSLINKNSKKFKAIMKKKKRNKQKEPKKLRCPVYKCFMDMADDEQLMKHFAEAHQDLKTLGLDLELDRANNLDGKSNCKGKVNNTLLTQTLMISLLHKSQIKEILKELNDEHPFLEV